MSISIESCGKSHGHYFSEVKNEVFKKHNAFFASTESEFNEKKTNEPYTRCLNGIFCPSANENEFINDIEGIRAEVVARRVKAEGIERIVLREIINQEVVNGGNIERVYKALEDYDVSERYIDGVLAENFDKLIEW